MKPRYLDVAFILYVLFSDGTWDFKSVKVNIPKQPFGEFRFMRHGFIRYWPELEARFEAGEIVEYFERFDSLI